MNTPRRVAVTGIGMVTPLGNDVESTWSAILGGESGVREISHFDASGFPTRIAAEVRDLDIEALVEDRKSLKYATPFSLFALVAAEEAICGRRCPADVGDGGTLGPGVGQRDDDHGVRFPPALPAGVRSGR